MLVYPNFDLLEASNSFLVDFVRFTKICHEIIGESSDDFWLKNLSNLNVYIDYLQKHGVYQSYYNGDESHQKKIKDVFSRILKIIQSIQLFLENNPEFKIEKISSNIDKILLGIKEINSLNE